MTEKARGKEEDCVSLVSISFVHTGNVRCRSL